MGTLTSSLKISLIDDVSGKAKTVAAALKQAEAAAKAVAKGMSGAGATDRFVKNLSGLKLSAKDIETVAKAWRDYAKSAGLAANSTQWTKAQASGVAAWERQTISALRAVKREQMAFNRAVGSGGGVSPMMAAMSQSAMANKRMIAGMSASGAREGGMMMVPMKAGKGGKIRGWLGGQAGDFATGMMMGSVGMMAGMKTYEMGGRAIEAANERQHQRVMSLNAGMTPQEVAKSEALAKIAQQSARNLSITDIMELHKEARSAVRDVREADEILTTLAQAKAVLKGSGIQGANVTDYVKGAEIYGFSGNPERMKEYIENQVKSAMVLGRTITTEEAKDIARYAKVAGATYSDRFINTTMPSLMQEMGGSQAGNALFMLSKHFRGGMQNKHIPVETMAALGLLEDPSQIVRSKTGSIKGYKGKVLGDSLLATDPDLWVYNILRPALEKAGYKALEDQTRILQQAMPGTAANVVGKLLQQEPTFKAHAQRYLTSPKLEGMVANQGKDATVAIDVVKNAFDNLSAAVMSSPAIAGGLNALADGINALTRSTESGALKALSNPSGWWEDTKARWGRVGEGAAGWLDKYKGSPGAFRGPVSAPAPRPPPDLRPSFTKMGDEAFRTGGRKKFIPPRSSVAGPMGVTGGITASPLPAFTRMQATPSVDSSSIDGAKAKIEGVKSSLETLNMTVTPHADTSSIDAVQGHATSAHTAVESLNMTATPTVNTGSIDAAIARAQQLHSILSSIGSAAAAAGAAASGAAAQASRAAAAIGSASAAARSNYVAPSVPSRT